MGSGSSKAKISQVNPPTYNRFNIDNKAARKEEKMLEMNRRENKEENKHFYEPDSQMISETSECFSQILTFIVNISRIPEFKRALDMKKIEKHLKIMAEDFSNYSLHNVKETVNASKEFSAWNSRKIGEIRSVLHLKEKIAIFGSWKKDELLNIFPSFFVFKLGKNVKTVCGKVGNLYIEALKKEVVRKKVKQEFKVVKSVLEYVKSPDLKEFKQELKRRRIKILSLIGREFKRVKGVFEYPGGVLYRGEMKNYLRHGYGEELAENGRYFYMGIWKIGKKTTRCLIVRKKDDEFHVYRGDNSNGEIEGLLNVKEGKLDRAVLPKVRSELKMNEIFCQR